MIRLKPPEWLAMAIKDILVHIDNSRSCSQRTRLAIELAQGYDAHLTGVYIVPRLTVPPYAEVYVPSTIYETQAELEKGQTAEAEKAFRYAVQQVGLNYEWRVVDDPIINSVSLHSHYADLVIVGQEDPDDPRYVPIVTPDDLVMRAGRPVLVVPYIGVQGRFARHVMVAWNGGREAVRAVHDAIPIMQRAEQVEVVSINPIAPGSEERIPSADICRHLARHGITANAQTIQARDIEVGDILLSRMADEGIDLLVMGAYGHSRFREMVLGGATKHILSSMTSPVLMSH